MFRSVDSNYPFLSINKINFNVSTMLFALYDFLFRLSIGFYLGARGFPCDKISNASTTIYKCNKNYSLTFDKMEWARQESCAGPRDVWLLMSLFSA